MDINKEIQEIVGNEGLIVKEKIDRLLALDCAMYTQLGINSKAKDKRKVKADSRVIYKAIRGLDKAEGDLLLKALDK